MILTCPSCGTQYVVKDGAIPPQGRQVRCASCKHSWHQDPEPADTPAEEEETIAEAALIDPNSGPEAEERAYEEAALAADDTAEPRSGAPEPVDEVAGIAPAEPAAPAGEPPVEPEQASAASLYAHEDAIADE